MSCGNEQAKRQTYLWAVRMAKVSSKMLNGAKYVVYKENAGVYGGEIYSYCKEEDFTEEKGVRITYVEEH